MPYSPRLWVANLVVVLVQLADEMWRTPTIGLIEVMSHVQAAQTCDCPRQVRLLNIGELRKDAIGALTFGAEIPPYKDGMLPSSPKLRFAFPTAPTWQVVTLPHAARS